jgi:acyl-CoA oxidase
MIVKLEIFNNNLEFGLSSFYCIFHIVTTSLPMIKSPHFEQNPSLYSFLPIFYLAWADAVLTPSEINNLQKVIEDQKWLSDVERQYLITYLDPKSPPSPRELKSWQTEIRKATTGLDVDKNYSLLDIGLTVAEYHGASHKDNSFQITRASLVVLEEVLGVISSEAIYHFRSKSHQVKSIKSSEKAAFDTQKMVLLLDGDQHEIIKRVKTVISDPAFAYVDESNLEEYREQVLKWCKLLADQGFGAMAYPKAYGGGGDMRQYFTIMETLSYHDLSLVIKFGVQFGLWGMSLYFLGTEKHHKKYLEGIGTLETPGCFAMTETGHGSNVKGLETTATYDRKSGNLVINTPHDHACKEYIGNAAVHGQKATVFAKLIIDEVDYGVNAFVVTLRDKKGRLSKGVRIEDCGRKMGLNGVDNGKIWFDQVEIPYDDMLDRFASIDSKGDFQSSITSDNRRFFTMLGTLVGGRIGIPRSGLSAMKSGLTIATKYANKRKQFGPENGEEIPILNYRTHQRRLMPLLAQTYALHFALRYLTDRFINRTEDDMQEIEALAAGLKSFTTWQTTATLQMCREACGGKGYLSENRIDRLKNDSDIYTTFEGDNTVLMQLVAKSRLSEFKKEFADINLFGALGYIVNQAKVGLVEMNPITVRNTDADHLLDFEFYLSAFRFRERDVLTSAARRIKKHLDAGMDSFDAFNQTQNHMVDVGIAYAERVVLEQFVEAVRAVEDPQLLRSLTRLCQLFALTQIEKNKGWYLEHDYMVGSKTKAIRRMVNQLCLEVREESVALVDAFDIPESCLGAQILQD